MELSSDYRGDSNQRYWGVSKISFFNCSKRCGNESEGSSRLQTRIVPPPRIDRKSLSIGGENGTGGLGAGRSWAVSNEALSERKLADRSRSDQTSSRIHSKWYHKNVNLLSSQYWRGAGKRSGCPNRNHPNLIQRWHSSFHLTH